jgi:hypothetical protein
MARTIIIPEEDEVEVVEIDAEGGEIRRKAIKSSDGLSVYAPIGGVLLGVGVAEDAAKVTGRRKAYDSGLWSDEAIDQLIANTRATTRNGLPGDWQHVKGPADGNGGKK